MTTHENHSAYRYALAADGSNTTVIDFAAYREDHPPKSRTRSDTDDISHVDVIILMPSNNNRCACDPDDFDTFGAA